MKCVGYDVQEDKSRTSEFAAPVHWTLCKRRVKLRFVEIAEISSCRLSYSSFGSSQGGPLEPGEQRRQTDALVVPILGMVLFMLSIGAMIVLYLTLPASSHSFWVAPIPLAFLGVGFLAFHFLSAKIER